MREPRQQQKQKRQKQEQEEQEEDKDVKVEARKHNPSSASDHVPRLQQQEQSTNVKQEEGQGLDRLPPTSAGNAPRRPRSPAPPPAVLRSEQFQPPPQPVQKSVKRATAPVSLPTPPPYPKPSRGKSKPFPDVAAIRQQLQSDHPSSGAAGVAVREVGH